MKKIYLILLLLAGICFSANAQVFTVSGVVRDDNDKNSDPTIPGAIVLEKGTTNGTVTDHSGQYRITCSPDATLVFSALGFISREISVNGLRIINVWLSQDYDWPICYPDSDPPGGGFLSLLPGADFRRGYMTTSIH